MSIKATETVLTTTNFLDYFAVTFPKSLFRRLSAYYFLMRNLLKECTKHSNRNNFSKLCICRWYTHNILRSYRPTFSKIRSWIFYKSTESPNKKI